MKYLDLTFTDGAQNLACEEALLEAAEQGQIEGVLRVWMAESYFIVTGYSNRAAREIDLAACDRLQIPVYRRFTGGGTVLQGPGCLNYTLVISNAQDELLCSISGAYEFVLRRHQRCLADLLSIEVDIYGSDLAIGKRKVSGNAQHRKRNFTLVHGTFLLQLNLELMEQVLPIPSKAPAYRRDRSHTEFLTVLPLSAASLKDGLRNVWQAGAELKTVPHERIPRLVQEKYSRKEWNFKF
jgi:lipoate-protein ligase A